MMWQRVVGPQAVVELACSGVHEGTVAAVGADGEGTVWLATGSGPLTRGVRKLVVSRRGGTAIVAERPHETARTVDVDDVGRAGDVSDGGHTSGVRITDGGTVTVFRARRGRSGQWAGRSWRWHLEAPGA